MDVGSRKANDLILLDPSVQTSAQSTSCTRALDDFVTLGVKQVLRRHAWRQRDVAIRTHDINLIRKPFNKAVLLRLLARRRCWLEDESGSRLQITLFELVRLFSRRVRAFFVSVRGRGGFLDRLTELESSTVAGHRYGDGSPLYLRTDLVFGMVAGGSVTHIAGVLNQFDELVGPVRMVTTDLIPTVSPEIDTVVVRPDSRLGDVPELNALLFNEQFERRVLEILGAERPRFIYQRYSVNNIAGLLLAARLQVPLVLEYNGSEVWINRHWGKVLDDEDTAVRLEQLNLSHASLIVVVSEVLAEELRARGVATERILVNPNGVDPQRYRPDIPTGVLRQRYRPDIPTGVLRQRYALEGQTVIGFIGSFGPWHGAHVLVEAFARLLGDQPELRGQVRLLMIGDGQLMPQVQAAIAQAGLDSEVILTGRVAQAEGPEYLALCDVLVSPHVPNPDGSAFFGSPTKLFEYMAMGRPIVASDLDQIGDVLAHEQNALLVSPGDPDAIAAAILRLLGDDRLAARLAFNARDAVLQRHTWRRHTDRILARLDELVDAHAG
jgi:glycosyltransferase involved in cell wall biosynthesis